MCLSLTTTMMALELHKGFQRFILNRGGNFALRVFYIGNGHRHISVRGNTVRM